MPQRPTEPNPHRAADVAAAARNAGLSPALIDVCARAADRHDWITVRRALIAAEATAHERALRDAYYRSP